MPMEGQIVHDASRRKRNQQQISVPFLWEDKPGTPKGEWPVNFPPIDPLPPVSPPPPPPGVVLPSHLPPPPPGVVLPSRLPPPPPGVVLPPLSPPPMPLLPGVVVPSRPPPPPPLGPAKFVVSVPFKWEEKPGTPLRSFAPEPPRLAVGENLPLPPAYSHLLDWFSSEGESASDDEDDQDELDWLAELDQTVGSTSSAPSLLANRLVATSAVPYDSSDSSPESGGSTSSYATGSTSHEGGSILEQLFPLYRPRKMENTNEKIGWYGMKDEANEVRFKGLKGGGNRSMIRRPPTLGELIMLSKRRSFVQRAAYMRKHSFSKEMEDENATGCFMFGSGRGGIAKMLARKSLLSLKLA